MEGDSPSKVPKTVLMKGQINIYEFRLTKKMADAIEANGGTTDNIRVIDHDDRVDVIAEGKLFAFGNTVWMAGDGFKSEVKIENGKFVAYTPPCCTTLSKKEIDELPFKELRYKLVMGPLTTLCGAFAVAGMPYEELRLAFEEKLKNMEDDVEENSVEEDSDEEDEEEDEGEDAGDNANEDLGNQVTDTTSEQGKN